jgi:hypothetical protein
MGEPLRRRGDGGIQSHVIECLMRRQDTRSTHCPDSPLLANLNALRRLLLVLWNGERDLEHTVIELRLALVGLYSVG